MASTDVSNSTAVSSSQEIHNNNDKVIENRTHVNVEESANTTQVKGTKIVDTTQVKGTESADTTQVKDTESTDTTQVKGTESKNKTQVKDTESTDKTQVKGTESTNKSQGKGTDSADTTQVKVKDSADTTQVKGTESADKTQVKGTESTDKILVKGPESTNKTQVKGIESTNKSQVKGTESTDKSQVKGTESTDKTQFISTESTDKTQVKGTESTDKPQVKSTESTDKTQVKVIESANKSHAKGSENEDKTLVKGSENADKTELKAPESTVITQVKVAQSTNKTEIADKTQVIDPESTNTIPVKGPESSTKPNDDSTDKIANDFKNSTKPNVTGTEKTTKGNVNETKSATKTNLNETKNATKTNVDGTENEAKPNADATKSSTKPSGKGKESVTKQNSNGTGSAIKQNSNDTGSAIKPKVSVTEITTKPNVTGAESITKSNIQVNGTESATKPNITGTENAAKPNVNVTGSDMKPKNIDTKSVTKPNINATESVSNPNITGKESTVEPRCITKLKVTGNECETKTNENVSLSVDKTKANGAILKPMPLPSVDLTSIAADFVNNTIKTAQNVVQENNTKSPGDKNKVTENVASKNHLSPIQMNKVPKPQSTDAGVDSSKNKTIKPEAPETKDALLQASGKQEKLSGVMTGQCEFNTIPPLPKKIVRIFVSSTFTDTKEERNALMQYVYPRLSDFCREKHGLEFQVVDMRWGVPEAASDNHSTSDLCIQEIKKCQQVSVGPNFVAIVGDKYGYRPIPSRICEGLFLKLKTSITSSIDKDVDWKTVEEWYRRDENAIPTEYILQPISMKIEHYQNTDKPELKKAAQNQWNTVNQILTNTLRKAAEAAFKSSQLSEQEKQIFFRSVTENEIQEGLMEGKSSVSETCFCIIRKIVDLEKNLSDPVAPRFADLQDQSVDTEARDLLENLRNSKLVSKIPESNLSKLEIEWLSSGAKVSIEKFHDIDVAKYAQESLKYQEAQLLQYKKYMDNLCENFFEKVSKLINEGGSRERELYDVLTSEILQHWHLAKMRCEIFEGREDILTMAKYYLESDTCSPLSVHGKSGCGKTSVMAKIMQNVAEGKWRSRNGNQFVMIARFLGTTPDTSNIYQLIVSICLQLSQIFGIDWNEPEKLSEVIKSFHKLLECGPDRQIVIILDSIDQLMPVYNAFKLNWLPPKLQKNVKLIMSTIDEGYTILQNAKERYGAGMKLIEINPLGEKLGLEIICKWLQNENRTMTEHQTDVIRQALQKCSLPLYARIAFDHIKKWKSYDFPKVEDLETTIRGAINKLYLSIEEKFGAIIVKHALSYLTASRHGLSEAELEHLLSLDDILLNQVFLYWNPPVRRVPPLLWTRIRTELQSYLVERSADDTLVLFWYHRQFIEATKDRYLKESEFSKFIHTNLVDFFSGKWGGGKEKPFEYSEAQCKRFGLKSTSSKADRKVPTQPYIVEGFEYGDRYNKRKLSELPFHLYKCRDYKEMKKAVFFNFEWLYAKLCSSSSQQLLEEFEIFMQADKVMKKDAEMKTLYANLQLIRPFIQRYPKTLSLELSGRLCSFIGKSESMTWLIKQCDSIGIKYCPIVPLVTSFETADVGLTQNIVFRKSEPWQEGGVFTCTKDFKTMYIFDYDQAGVPQLLIYDISTGEKINSLAIDKPNCDKSTVDVYIQAEVSTNGRYLFGFYREKYVDGFIHRFKDAGSVNIIDTENGKVLKTYEGYLFREEYANPLQYLTKNNICVRFGLKMPIYNFKEDTKREINRPTMLSFDEKYFIMCGQKKTELKIFATNELVGEFDTEESQMAVAATKDFGRVAMIGRETKQIRVFYMGSKQLHANKKYGFLLKYKKAFELNSKVLSTVADLFQPVTKFNEKGEKEEKTNNSVFMRFGNDGRNLVVIFRGTENWIAYVWNTGRYNAKFVNSITDKMPTTAKFPAFNYDGSFVAYCKEKDLLIHSSETGELVNKYEMNDIIKDFYMSDLSDKVAVMQSKSIALLNVTRGEGIIRGKSKRNMLNKTSSVLIEREISTLFIHKDIIVSQLPGSENVQLEEMEDIGMASNTDRLASARSKVRYAVEKHVSPDGLKVIHYHTRVQVIDTKSNQIVYTPKTNDVILRVNAATASTDTIKIPGLEPGSSNARIFDLVQSDRIVNENNKVKFRVNQEPNGQFKIMNVPSILTVYSAEEEKLQKLQRITVYQENILTVGNKFCVTNRRTNSGFFIIVYNLLTGKDVATHQTLGANDCAKFSFDEIQLFVVDENLNIKVFHAPDYNTVEQKLSLIDSIGSSLKVKEIISFKQNRDLLMIRYGPNDNSFLVCNRYMRVNLVTKEKSAEMELSHIFDDIAEDGSVAIDTELKLYNLGTGRLMETTIQPPHEVAVQKDQVVLKKHQANFMNGCSRLSKDLSYMLYLEKQTDTVHLYSIENDCAVIKISCHTHQPNVSLSNGLELRHYGRIFVLRTPDEISAFAILDQKDQPIDYTNEMSRSLSIADNIWSTQTGNALPNTSRKLANDIFEKKYSLREENEEEEELDEAEELEQHRSSRPSVLVLAESILAQFKASRFTAHLSTHLTRVTSAEEANKELRSLTIAYNAIVLQLIVDDVKFYDVKSCVEKISTAVDLARRKCGCVVVSLAPARMDQAEFNQKTEEVNQKIKSMYGSSSKGVVVLEHANLSENGRPLHKYFKDGFSLNANGIKQISINIKEVLQKELNMDII